MSSTLSKMMGAGEQSGDGMASDQLKRAAGRGAREAVKGIVKEAIEESATESKRSGRGGTGRGMAMLGLGAIAGYLVRDWQLNPEAYEGLGEEFADIPEEIEETREEAMEQSEREEESGGSSRLGRILGLALLAGISYAVVRRRRKSKQGEQWTEQRDQESTGGLSTEHGSTGGDAGRMTGESSGMGAETTGMGTQSSEMGGEEGQESTTGSSSSESSYGGSSDSDEGEESNE